MARTADQTSETGSIALEVFGVEVVVGVVGSRGFARRVRQSFPAAPGEWQVDAGTAELGIYSDPGGYRVVGATGTESEAGELAEAIEQLRMHLIEHVASHARDHLFIRGRAAAMGGQAIVLVGEPTEEGSTLLAALVGGGAHIHAEDYVPIDRSGQVHPDPLCAAPEDGNAAVAAGIPVPVAVVAALARRPGEPLALREELSETGVLTLLKHAIGARHRPEFALSVAREAVGEAAMLSGRWDSPQEAAAALIERLARVPRRAPRRTELPVAIQFESLVLELEAQLAELAETLNAAAVEPVLLNGDQVRRELAHGFAFSYAARVELPRSQVPRALGAMEAAGWRPVIDAAGTRYFRNGVVVEVRPRSAARLLTRARRRGSEPIIKGRLGLPEPESNVAAAQPRGSLTPQAFDPGPAPLRIGSAGEALSVAADGLTVLDSLRLRTRERQFRGLAVQYGPGVHAFDNALEGLVDEVLVRLPGAPERPLVVDMGTGTGILALCIALERPNARVLATDVSLRALGWARRNRRRLAVRNVRLAQGSLLAPVPTAWRGRVSAIVSNPPMALPAHAVELRARFAGPVGTATGPAADGLGLVRALASDARDVLAPGGYLCVEVLGYQGPWVDKYLGDLGYEAELPSIQPYISVAARWPGRG